MQSKMSASFSNQIWSSEIVAKGRFYEIDWDANNEKWESWPGYSAYTSDNPGQSAEAMVKVKRFLASVQQEARAQKLEGAEGCVDAERIGRFLDYKLSPKNNDSVVQHLLKVSKTMPPKGSSGPSQIMWYKKQFGTSSFEAGVRAARDFFTSYFVFQFTDVPSLNYKLLGACGSLISITLAVDYYGASDEEKWGGLGIFTTAAVDGFDFLLEAAQGTDRGHIRTAYDDLVKVCAYIGLRKTFENPDSGATSRQLDDYTAPLNLSPARFLELRWWDASMVPYHRVIMGFANAHLPCDADGTPCCAKECPRIRRAIDSLIRYNEVIDVISDGGSDERFNEVLVAFAVGEVRVVKNYARALAAVIEDVIKCDDCSVGPAGHQWAADLAIGAAVIYAISPRYQMIRQLWDAAEWQRKQSALPVATRGHFLPGLTSVSELCKLENGAELHKDNWEPAWYFVPNEIVANTSKYSTAKCAPCDKAAHFISQRILRREPRSDEKGRQLMALVYGVIVDSKWHLKIGTENFGQDHCVPFDPVQYSQIWHRLCTLLYNFKCETPAGVEEVEAAADILEEMIRHYCHAIWTTRTPKTEEKEGDNPGLGQALGNKTGHKPGVTDPDNLIPISVHVCTAMDKAVRDTHLTAGCYGDGAWRRHVIIGLGATFLEFCTLAYDQLIDYAFGMAVDKK